MEVALVTPASPDALLGNAVTASRWAKLLVELGHRVEITTTYEGTAQDVLIALHARRSAPAVVGFRERRPGRPIIVGLAGTDVYRDIKDSPEAQHAIEIADRLVVLQPKAIEELPSYLHHKTRVIFQSATAPVQTSPKPKDAFQVCVLAHLREVKDPLRAAYAARLLPSTSRTRVIHAGQALSEIAAQEARQEERQNTRYRWLEGLSRKESKKLLSGSHLLVISSLLEGGANVASEAIAASVPILASRIPGNVGILGDDYPGYFETGHTQQLSTLLERAESDHSFFQTLVQTCQRLTHFVDPAREADAWRDLLAEFVVS